MAKRHIIFMVSPQRTGSSLLAELLASHPDYTTGQTNAHGENMRWVHANIALTKAPEDEPFPCDVAERFQEILRLHPGNLILKTHQSCFTIHRWLKWFDRDEIRPSVVVTYRSPACIAESLRRLGEFDVEETVGRYWGAVFGNLAKCADTDPVFVRYEQLVTEPAMGMMLLAMQIGMPEPYEFDLALVQKHRWRNRPTTLLG